MYRPNTSHHHPHTHHHHHFSSDASHTALNKEAVAKYLAPKPNFVKKWFKENATTDLLDECIRLKEQNDYLSKPRASVIHEMFNNIVQGNSTHRAWSSNGNQMVDYLKLNEYELFFELIRDVANELSVHVLCHKILINVLMLTNFDWGSLFPRLKGGSYEINDCLSVCNRVKRTLPARILVARCNDGTRGKSMWGTRIRGPFPSDHNGC